MHMTEPLLTVSGLDISFRSATGVHNAVRDVEFDINPGEIVAIVGESGSGKSVTARAVMSMLAKNAIVGARASIRFKGREVTETSEIHMQAMRGSEVSMIFQEPLTSLNPLYKVGDQVTEIITTHRTMSKEAVKAEVLRLLDEVRLPDPEAKYDQYPHELSGGQRQRVMIAMAIANAPELLIADEPTTALDVTVQSEILSLLKDMQSRYGMSIMLITHDLSVVRHMADRTVVMRKGEIVETGDTSVVLTNPEKPYTKHLIDSEPKGQAEPLEGTSDPILSGANLCTEFKLKGTGFFGRGGKNLIAVNDVSLAVQRGETLGIVGESGSGKTTLGMGMIGIGTLTSGEVHFDGARIDGLNRKQMRPLRPRLQVVFQDPFSSLNPRMIIRQILSEGLIVNGIGKNSAEREKLIRDALAEVQMEPDALSRFPHEFSGGQRQRLAIARAIVLKPEFILLDEPTSALDLSIQAQIIDLLRDLRRKHGLSYLFISHDLKVVRALCHRVLVMKDGRVLEEGPTEQVLNSPKNAYTERLVNSAFEMAV